MWSISRCRIVALFIHLLAFAPSLASAASFNCARARTPIERTICASPELSVLDEKLGDVYRLKIRQIGDRQQYQAYIAAQKNWIDTVRGACAQDTACLVDAYKQRIATLEDIANRQPAERETPWAAAAPCDRPDPANADQVFACMASARFRNAVGPASEKNVFATVGAKDCMELAMSYPNFLEQSGAPLPNQYRAAFTPSCEVFAKAVQSLTGEAAYWSGCLSYPGKFDAGHLQSCLSRALPAHGNKKLTLQSLKGCSEVTQEYERALRNADTRRMLPDGYQKPDCAVVAGLLGKGGACLNYEASAPHVQACLGLEINN